MHETKREKYNKQKIKLIYKRAVIAYFFTYDSPYFIKDLIAVGAV